MPKRGFNAVRWMRDRPEGKRGGQEKPDDGFTRGGPTLAVYADQYLDWMRVHNSTPAAVASRWEELKTFLRWAEERSLIQPWQVSRTILESYQRHLWRFRRPNDKLLGISTQRAKLTAVKIYFGWLCKQRFLEANPAADLELPRPEKRLPIMALSIAEMETILAQPDVGDPLGIRDRSILEMFYSTGIRRSELVHLELSDLNRDRHLLRVRLGKGRKDRMVPVGARALQWVGKYLDDIRPLLLGSDTEATLFVTGYGGRFNAEVLGRKVADYITQANIGRRAGAHLIRRTCATHLLEGGADIRYIQQLLGHEKLETTAIYTEVSILQLQAVHARCHPAERPRKHAAANGFVEPIGGAITAEISADISLH